MVKSVTSLTGNGLRDWLVQRLTSVYLAIGFVALLLYLGLHPDLNYATWQQLLSHTGLRVAVLGFFICLALHAWVGLWTITADYLKGTSLRLIIHSFILFVLIAALIWSAAIMWGQ